MYCCSADMIDTVKKLAQELVNSNHYKLGVDLELVHSYFKESPAIIYRSLYKITHQNDFLASEVVVRNTIYDAGSDMLIFPHLNDVKVFETVEPILNSRRLRS